MLGNKDQEPETSVLIAVICDVKLTSPSTTGEYHYNCPLHCFMTFCWAGLSWTWASANFSHAACGCFGLVKKLAPMGKISCLQ